MRQVESIVNFLTAAILKKKTPGYELSADRQNSDADLLHERLNRLIRAERFNEAEDLLFEKLDPDDERYLELAVDFYSQLNRLDNDTLERNGFSREEVGDGLKEAAARFGVSLSGLF